jgi:hypothetical protein
MKEGWQMDDQHPRFRLLSQAVRAGIQIVPDAAPPRRFFGVSAETGRLGCDALAAAWFAEYYDSERLPGPEEHGLDEFLSVRLTEAYPVLKKVLGPGCPAGPGDRCPTRGRGGQTLEAKVIHLEDEHGLGREKVADWLQLHGF